MSGALTTTGFKIYSKHPPPCLSFQVVALWFVVVVFYFFFLDKLFTSIFQVDELKDPHRLPL
jgi:hypothetical protein